MAAKGPIGGGLQSREPPRGHLAAKRCSGFVVEANNYRFNVDDPMSLTSLMEELFMIRDNSEHGGAIYDKRPL